MNINSGDVLTWDTVAGATGYEVELLNASLGQSLAMIQTADEVVTAAELFTGRPFGNYNVQVRATEAAGPGAWSSILPLTFVSLPAPQNVRVE